MPLPLWVTLPVPDSTLSSTSVSISTSITKPVVYMGALMLVERGLLNLSDPVMRYIPDFAAHHKEGILVQHLFTHTSGLPDMLTNDRELRAQHAPLETFIQAAVRDTVPLFPAGSNWSYQSMGTLVVAELIQQISGQRLSDYLQQNILQPLGLLRPLAGLRPHLLRRLELPELHLRRLGPAGAGAVPHLRLAISRAQVLQARRRLYRLRR